MSIIDKVQNAISKNEMRNFLEGNGEYFIPDREGDFSNVSAALYVGIYEYFKSNPQSNLKEIFEKTLQDMLLGNELDIMIAFHIIYLQMLAEVKGLSPFEMSKDCYVSLKECVEKNSERLKKYKSHPEYGAFNQNGAYEYIVNINKYMEEKYGRKLI